MFQISDKIKVKIGNGLLELPGKIISVSTDHTYSVKAKLKDGKKVVMHRLKEEDLKPDIVPILNNLLDKVLEGKVEHLKEVKEAKRVVEMVIDND